MKLEFRLIVEVGDCEDRCPVLALIHVGTDSRYSVPNRDFVAVEQSFCDCEFSSPPVSLHDILIEGKGRNASASVVIVGTGRDSGTGRNRVVPSRLS